MPKSDGVRNRGLSVTERFWLYVQKNDEGCWPWTGASNEAGYGWLRVDGKNVMATHISHELHTGQPVPDGLMMLHTCDNPPCVRPDHIYPGDHDKNMQDKVARNRQYRPAGEEHHGCRLTEEQVKAIFDDKRTQHEIAVTYGVSDVTISQIQCGRRWGSVTGINPLLCGKGKSPRLDFNSTKGVPKPHQNGSLNTKAKLSDAQVLAIRADKRKTAILCEEYGVSRTTMCTIRSGRAWKHLLPPTEQLPLAA